MKKAIFFKTARHLASQLQRQDGAAFFPALARQRRFRRIGPAVAFLIRTFAFKEAKTLSPTLSTRRVRTPYGDTLQVNRRCAMSDTRFERYFTGKARDFLIRSIDLALEEDGPDLTAMAVFAQSDRLTASIVAKEEAVMAGLPIAALVLERMGQAEACQVRLFAADGQRVANRTVVAELIGPAITLLKAERVILNYICHLSGIASMVARAVAALAGSKTRLLDTRKTLPGLRYPEKYAVVCGGGVNHRIDLAAMLMLKDNHIDRAGGIPQAMAALRKSYHNRMDLMPPVEIECRTLDEVAQAVAETPKRLMLDNMDEATMRKALALVPGDIETEVSGGVDLDALAGIGALGPDFVSVGRITHSAKSADFSMLLKETPA
jgi:nicotinate-nucleotide pyrophosphorylase (carboxylating)